ncbi:MAG: UTP--glucose-1-phosphate uridylyltransferase [Clostridia bacterium]|nr:UTP--glucose-1-phosphate uridylyltransferase [Clostridia bacterium]
MQKVKKAIIPVAGYGTRFLPFTKALPKTMLPVINVPAIQHVIQEAVDSGIEEIYLIVGKHANIISEHFSPANELEGVLKARGNLKSLEIVQKPQNLAKITYIVQEEQKGTGHAVMLAEKYIKNEPFAVLFGDDLMCADTPVLKQLISVYEKNQKTVIGVKHVGYENVSKYASCEYNSEDKGIYNLTSIIEKPAPGSAKSDLAPLGRYVLRANFFENIKNIKPGYNGEYQLTDALGLEIKKDGLLAYAFEGERYDMGDVFGFLQANVEFSLKDDELKDKMKKYLEDLVKKF